MKRFLLLGIIAVVLAAASIVLAQSPSQAILRLPNGDRPVPFVQQGSQTFVSAQDVITALGGSMFADSNGYKVTYANSVAAFGPDSRFGVVRDDLIEMPVPPISLEGKPFVPWQFFSGFLGKTATPLEVTWDNAAHVLSIRPQVHDLAGVQVLVTNLSGLSKLVATLTMHTEYAIVKEPGAYIVRFKTPIRPPFTEQAYEDPYVQKIAFAGNDLRVQLTSPDVAGDVYELDNPPRVVVDFRKVAAPQPGAQQPVVPGASKPVDQPGIHTIVLDPGHGGRDVGATGPGGLLEKDATLAICRKLQDALAAKLNTRVILTREDDSLISLDQRTAIANQYKADLFLSVHLNAAVVKGAKGSETYFLSLEASDEVAKKAAEVENVQPMGPIGQAPPPASSADLKMILWDLAQQEYLNESSKFAQDIQEEMNSATGVQNRGVKQAPFKVLVGATMPAALVEVAFISNPEEEAKIKSDDFQKMMVEALTRAVERYKTDYETRIGIIHPAPAAPAAPATRTGT